MVKADKPTEPQTTIVGVGASAGGVNALQEFFAALPAKVGAAFVVIVHLDPRSHSELPEILATRTRMPVKQVTKTAELKPDCIYVIAPDRQLRISDNEIAALPFKEPRGQRAPIDLFFRSLAEQHGDGFAVILTGAGSDGAIGVKAVKESGGIVLVQDPDEAEYSSMPRAAIATEAADLVLPIKEIAERLVELVRTKRRPDAEPHDGEDADVLLRILAHLRVRTGHDFTNYKRATIMRRIARRMNVARRETLEEYFAHLRENAEEGQALLADLLISVTTFFRDPKAFETLATKAIPRLFETQDATDPIRVWVVGCATGEEAYSIAMLLLEEATRHDLHREIQVFATDMDVRALAIAREGRYPIAIETDVSEDRISKFFQRDGGHYRVKRELRDTVLFANHSLLKDPAFSHLDLVSCRNLLIYLNRDLQQQVISTLQYALNGGGYLFLGSSETAEHRDHLFHVVDREARLFQSSGRAKEIPPLLPRVLGMTHIGDRTIEHNADNNLYAAKAAHREALESLAPPSVVVNSAHRILHLSENAGRYLQLPGGVPSSDITELVREEIRHDLRAALHRAFEHHETVLSRAVRIQFNGAARRVYVQVTPIGGREVKPDEKLALVVFIEGEAPAEQPAPAAETTSDTPRSDVVLHLQEELDAAHTRLRTTREDSEATNEELRAANEELQSINEEYRSTAEELETSKEELQSINEELQTVNAELKLKLDTVSRANSDLQNLMSATDFATLFLDTGFRIKRFTPRTLDIFNITLGDVGRPISNFTHKLAYQDLAGDARKVLKDLTPMEREVSGNDGRAYLVRARPYRTVDDKIDGVVFTFVDVTERQRMENALRASEERLRQETQLVELSRAPIFVWDFDGGIRQWNRGSEELYGYSRDEAIGRTKEAVLKTTVPGSSFKALKQKLVESGTWNGELHQTTKDGRQLIVDSHIELIEMGGRRLVLESTRDITHRKTWEARQRMLLGELTHRVKNILAVVQAMVHQTWRGGGSSEEFMHRLDGRLAALSRSHSLLVESEWEGADLRKLVENQLGPYVGDNGRVRFTGDPIAVPADVATPLGLVLHELATNAVKYGALSNDKGRVDVNWDIGRWNKTSQIRFTWQEVDGPGVKKPSSNGFGSRLIKQGLPGAMVKHEFLPQGIKCSIEIPLAGQPGGDGTDSR